MWTCDRRSCITLIHECITRTCLWQRDLHERGSRSNQGVLSEPQRVHGADRDTDTTTDAGGIGISDGFLFQGKVHNVDSDLAVSGALVTADALVIRNNLESTPSQSGKEMGLQMHQFCQRAPITAPDLSTEERVESDRQDPHQPDIGAKPVKVDPQLSAARERGKNVFRQHQSRHAHCEK